MALTEFASHLTLKSSAELARLRVDRWIKRYEPGYRELARYAALPLILTPELLHYLRTTFLGTRLPWVATADLLLSELCEEIGYEQYAMDLEVRSVLLAEMREGDGPQRMRQVAGSLLKYVQALERTNPGVMRQELEAQRWAALVYLDSAQAAADLREHLENARSALKSSGSDSARLQEVNELLRLTELTRHLEPALKDHAGLLDYAREVTEILRSPTPSGSPTSPSGPVEWPGLAVRPNLQEVQPGLHLLHDLDDLGGVVFRMAWSPDGRYLACPTVKGQLFLWNFEAAKPSRRSYNLSPYGINQVSWSPDSQHIATALFDRTLRIWRATDGREVARIGDHKSDVRCVEWSSDGRFIVSGTEFGTLRIFRIDANFKGDLLTNLRPSGHGAGSVNAIALSPDQKHLAVGYEGGQTMLYRMTDGELTIVRSQVVPSKQAWSAVTSLAWSPDSGMLAVGYRTGKINTSRIGDKIRQRELDQHRGAITSLSFDCSGRILASKGRDNRVRFWNIETGKVLSTLEEPSSNYTSPGISFHPYLPVLATLGGEARQADRRVRVFQVDIDGQLNTRNTPAKAEARSLPPVQRRFASFWDVVQEDRAGEILREDDNLQKRTEVVGFSRIPPGNLPRLALETSSDGSEYRLRMVNCLDIIAEAIQSTVASDLVWLHYARAWEATFKPTQDIRRSLSQPNAPYLLLTFDGPFGDWSFINDLVANGKVCCMGAEGRQASSTEWIEVLMRGVQGSADSAGKGHVRITDLAAYMRREAPGTVISMSTGIGEAIVSLTPDTDKVELLKPQVLWVDDNPGNIWSAAEALRQRGLDVTLANDTAEALNLTDRQPFDAILSDMGRPGDPYAGYTLLSALQKRGINVPFIICSRGGSKPSHQARARRQGAFGSIDGARDLPKLLDEALIKYDIIFPYMDTNLAIMNAEYLLNLQDMVSESPRSLHIRKKAKWKPGYEEWHFTRAE